MELIIDHRETKIKDYFDIAAIHHITPPDGKCDKELWVDEFSSLLKDLNILLPGIKSFGVENHPYPLKKSVK